MEERQSGKHLCSGRHRQIPEYRLLELPQFATCHNHHRHDLPTRAPPASEARFDPPQPQTMGQSTAVSMKMLSGVLRHLHILEHDDSKPQSPCQGHYLPQPYSLAFYFYLFSISRDLRDLLIFDTSNGSVLPFVWCLRKLRE